MYKNIMGLFREIFPFAVATSIVVGTIITLLFGNSVLRPFVLGTAVSFLNFILLAVSTYIVVNFNSSKAKNMHSLFFLIRYAVIAIVVYTYASKHLFNTIYVILGITMVLFSMKISAFVKHYTGRKESKNGGNKSCI